MTSYQDAITWTAEQTWFKWQREEIGWKGATGTECNAIAFIYDKTVYEVNQDIWREVIEMFGDPLARNA